MSKRLTTRVAAERWLAEYECANADLPAHTRRLLGVYTLAAKRTPSSIIDEILGYPSASPYRDVSRRWWLVLSTSGLGRYWNTFKRLAEREGVGIAYRWLRQRRVARKKWAVFRRRVGGVRPWGASAAARRRHQPQRHGTYWFKAGTWDRKSVWTRLLIEGASSASGRWPPRHAWQRKLQPYLRQLERECHRLIDPNVVTVPEAKALVLAYVQRRVPELLGWPRRRVGPKMCMWVLGLRTLPLAGGRTLVYRGDGCFSKDLRSHNVGRPR